MKVIPEMRSAH